MAQRGTDHWRRAVAYTFAAIFAVSLLAGLLGSVTRGALAVTAQPGRPQASTTSASQPPSQSQSPSRSPSKSRSRSQPVSAQVAAVGEDALLQLSDLPAGWVSGSAPAAPARVSPWSPRLARCVGVAAHTASLAPTKVDSPDFTSANKQLAVEDSVSVYPSAATAQREYAAMASTRTTRCMNAVAGPTLEASMQRDATSGTTIGRVTFSSLPTEASAQHEAGFTVSIPVAAGGRVLAITSTQVDFVHGALLHQVTFDGNGTTFPAPLEIDLLATAQSRG